MTVPRPTLPAYSPGRTTGYMVSGTDYDNDVLQQGAWTQLMLGAQTSFPASPAAGDTCFRSDLNALYQCTNATGPVWTQMSIGSFATTARPASPPTNYRYVDLTDGFTRRWTGSAYQKVGTAVKQLDFVVSTDILNAVTAVQTTWTNVITDQSFTVEDANSGLLILLNLGMNISAGASATQFGARLLIDGATAYPVYGTVANASGFTAVSGGAVHIGTLSAGSHTARVQYFVSGAASTIQLRASSQSNIEFLRLQVVEQKP